MNEIKNKTEENKKSVTQVIEKEELNEEVVEVENTEPTKEHNKTIWIVLITIAILIILVALFSTIFAVINMKSDKVLKGITINEIDISELTKEQAIEKLNNIYGTRAEQQIYLTHGEYETSVTYEVPSRGLIGFMTNFLTMTKGYGIISHTFMDYRPAEGDTVGKRQLGVLISIDQGQSTAYSLGSVEDRGTMFIGPGVEVYEGMIVGEHSRDNDLVVNVTKGKNLTNTRSSSKDSTVVLKKPRQFNLEACLDYINDDELVEVTPENIRLRKLYLTEQDRKRAFRAKLAG